MGIVEQIVKVLGGIALLLFGIELMSNSLKKIAGNRFKSMIEKTTNTPLKGVILGTLATAVIQSSTGVTVLTVGLVRAGLMTLPQSVGIIMGANIGTTFTVFLMALPITEYGLLMIFIGVVMTFISYKKVREYGGVLVGLGMLFFGLDLMNALKELAVYGEPMFKAIGNNWFTGTLFGTVFTAIIQSSTAFMGILVKLYEIHDPANGVFTIGLAGALPLILGSNIGTTLSSLVASIGGNAESKKTALIHVMFNVIGSLIFLIGLQGYVWVVEQAQIHLFKGNKGGALGFAHLFQNAVSTFILFFFIKQQIWLVNKMVKDDGPKTKEIVFNDKLIEESTELALEVAKNGIMQMFGIVHTYFSLARQYSFKKDHKAFEESENLENMIDVFDEKIHDYLIKIAAKGLSRDSSNRLSRNLDVTKDLERIGDHLNNIVELFKERYEMNAELSDDGSQDLNTLYDKLSLMFDKTMICYEQNDMVVAKEVLILESELDTLEETFRYQYIERLKEGKVVFIVSANYADILSNIERIGDHLNNIAEAVIEPMRIPLGVQLKKHDTVQTK